jgi:hypothetical protein
MLVGENTSSVYPVAVAENARLAVVFQNARLVVVFQNARLVVVFQNACLIARVGYSYVFAFVIGLSGADTPDTQR